MPDDQPLDPPRDAGWSDAKLSPKDYRRLAAYIESQTGIRMPLTRITMLESRLRQRLRAFGLSSYSAYCEHLFGDGGDAEELAHLVARATTNTTEFFRERSHFEHLVAKTLPERRRTLGHERELMVWSAGCSSGEEPYTLAMVLAEAQAAGDGFSHRILATDISVDMLTLAERGIYQTERIAGIPRPLRKRYLMQSKDPARALVRIVPELRQMIRFRLLNLMDEQYHLERPVDVLFCRNVFIYFDRHTQYQVLLHLVRTLVPGGYLYLGHTDTIHGLSVPLRQIAPAVYRKVG